MKTITANTRGIEIVYQNTGKSSFVRYENTENESHKPQSKHGNFNMNAIQYKMYQQLMYGLDAFDVEQRTNMDSSTAFAIKNRHERAKDVINKIKYDRAYGYINKLFKVVFPHIKLDYHIDGRYADLPTIRELKISTLDIVDAWISNKLLPLDFYNLNEQTVEL